MRIASRRALLGVKRATAAPAPDFTGMLDAVTTSMVHAYAPVRLLASYTGSLLRLRRLSDDAELDFGYDANGHLDDAAIATWLAATTGVVVTMYDQKGTDNITQATAANQPAYTAAAQNGHSGVVFNGTSDFLRSPAANYGQNVTLVICVSNVSRWVGIFDSAPDTPNMLRRNLLGWEIWSSSPQVALGEPNPGLIAITAIRSPVTGRTMTTRKNGADGNSGSSANTISIAYSTPTIGTIGEVNFFSGTLLSFVVFAPSIDATSTETALNTYWAVY